MKVTKRELKEYLVEKLKEMQESEFSCDKEYSFQFQTLFCYAAGYAPEMPVGDVYKIVSDLIS